jgi:hypothetical protein
VYLSLLREDDRASRTYTGGDRRGGPALSYKGCFGLFVPFPSNQQHVRAGNILSFVNHPTHVLEYVLTSTTGAQRPYTFAAQDTVHAVSRLAKLKTSKCPPPHRHVKSILAIQFGSGRGVPPTVTRAPGLQHGRRNQQLTLRRVSRSVACASFL